MKALILSTEFPPGPGGIGTHAWELARNLVKSKWEITVATPQEYASINEIVAFNQLQPYPVLCLSTHPRLIYRLIQRWRILSAWIKENTPNVIIASGSRSVWLAAGLSRFFEIPLVAIGHGSEFLSKSPIQKYLTRWAFQKAKGVICVSEFTKRQMMTSIPYSNQLSVIPNGADPNSFHILPSQEREAFRSKLGFSNARLILTVGNVTERKGQEVVIKSLPNVLEEIPDIQYMIVGLPTKRKELEALAQQLGVLDRIHFFGRVNSEELVCFLNICDVFVMTSRMTVEGDFEGYGIAVVEAALCGKPSIVSDNSGLSEAVVSNETALIVRENDEKDTAKAIIQILTNNEFRQSMGEKARRRALGEQTWAKRIALYDQFLQQLLESNERQEQVFATSDNKIKWKNY